MTLREQSGLGGCGIWSELVDEVDKKWFDIVQDARSGKFATRATKDWRTSVRRGGFPTQVIDNDTAAQRSIWFEGYIQTYLERDLSQLSNIENLPNFHRLMVALSHRIGQVINQTELARITGISQPTINRYLNLLQVSYQIVRLPAYVSKKRKRLIKSP